MKGRLDARGSTLRRGVMPLLTYAVLTAAMDVYAGNRLQVVSPASIAAISFTLVVVFFAAVHFRQSEARRLSVVSSHRRDLVAINITTAVTWLSTFYALSYLEPAIVNVMALALGPAIMVLVGPQLRQQSTVMRVEIAVSAAICILLGVLAWSSFTGRSGLGRVSAGHTAAGVVFTLICAAGSAVNIIYMKRLNDAGCNPGTVLATRFILMSVAGWVLVALEGQNGIFAALLPGAIVAVGGVGLPIYILQIGVRYTEPITTSLLISLSPLFAFVMELADRRLRFSPFTLGGVLSVVALVVIGVMSRDRQSTSHRPDPARLAAIEAVGSTQAHDELISDERGDSRIMKTAIVDAYGAGRLLPSALKHRGVDFVHVRSQFPDTRLAYRPEDFTVDIEHAGDIERTAQALRDLGVNWVVAAAESGVVLADQLTSALDLPGNDPRLTLARRDKFAMQGAVRAAALASADCFCSPSISEVTEWAVRHGQWPVVLKPVLSAGTDNVFICRTLDEVAAAHAKIMTSDDRYGRPNKVVLVQRFLSGAEHYVNSVSRNGVHQIIEVWRYHKRVVKTRPFRVRLRGSSRARRALSAGHRELCPVGAQRSGAP